MLKKIFLLNLISFAVLFARPVLAYDQNSTHPALTIEIIYLYETKFGSEFIVSSELKKQIIQGSIDEDTPPRWLNHFYDPVYNVGWKGYNTSKVWAQSPFQDYSWSKALDYYAKGDKAKAYYALGRILHLIEDSSVAEHTRNDTHAGNELPYNFTNNSPYEDWTKQFKPTGDATSNTNLAGDNVNERFNLRTDLGQYFDFLAPYTNNNFFSEDTIYYQKYLTPHEFKRDMEYGYGIEIFSGEKFHLFKILTNRVDEQNKLLTLDNEAVLSDYWRYLSKQAVLTGVGVLKLFNEQAEVALAQEKTRQGALQSMVNFLGEPFVDAIGNIKFFVQNETQKAINNTASNLASAQYYVAEPAIDATVKSVKDTAQDTAAYSLSTFNFLDSTFSSINEKLANTTFSLYQSLGTVFIPSTGKISIKVQALTQSELKAAPIQQLISRSPQNVNLGSSSALPASKVATGTIIAVLTPQGTAAQEVNKQVMLALDEKSGLWNQISSAVGDLTQTVSAKINDIAIQQEQVKAKADETAKQLVADAEAKDLAWTGLPYSSPSGYYPGQQQANIIYELTHLEEGRVYVTLDNRNDYGEGPRPYLAQGGKLIPIFDYDGRWGTPKPFTFYRVETRGLDYAFPGVFVAPWYQAVYLGPTQMYYNIYYRSYEFLNKADAVALRAQGYVPASATVEKAIDQTTARIVDGRVIGTTDTNALINILNQGSSDPISTIQFAPTSIFSKVSGLWDSVTNIYNQAKAAVSNAINWVVDKAKEVVSTVASYVTQAAATLYNNAAEDIAYLSPIVKSAANSVVNKVTSAAKSVASSIYGAAVKTTNFIANTAKQAAQAVSNVVSSVSKGISNLWSKLW